MGSKSAKGFQKLPNSLAWDPDVNGAEFKVLTALNAHMNRDTGECYPSLNALAKETGYDPKTVSSALSRLRDKGLVSWKPRYYGDTKSRASNVYTVNLERYGNYSGTLPEKRPNGTGKITPRGRGKCPRNNMK